MKHPTCDECKHSAHSINQFRPWMRNCAINNQEWHKDDYCSNHSEPIPDYESLLASERSKVIAEVREVVKPYLEKTRLLSAREEGAFKVADEVDDKLDSMAGKVDAE